MANPGNEISRNYCWIQYIRSQLGEEWMRVDFFRFPYFHFRCDIQRSGTGGSCKPSAWRANCRVWWCLVLEIPVPQQLAVRIQGQAIVESSQQRFAARFEYARTVEDVLARRCRLLFLDAAQAAGAAPAVADILRQELGRDPDAGGFEQLAAAYAKAPA